MIDLRLSGFVTLSLQVRTWNGRGKGSVGGDDFTATPAVAKLSYLISRLRLEDQEET